MPVERDTARINHSVTFADGTAGDIVHWLDDAGSFHDRPIARPLAIIVRNPLGGYDVIDLREAQQDWTQPLLDAA